MNPNKKDDLLEIGIVTDDRLKKISEGSRKLCEKLSISVAEFKTEEKKKEFLQDLKKYLNEYGRIIYTEITTYIFEMNEEKATTILSNIDSLVHYVYSEEYNKWVEKEYSKEVGEKLEKIVLKLWDHINLARKQYIMFHHKDEDYGKIVEEKMEGVSVKISKEMNIQLISLVAIFTALSFLVFGGISSLDNIFAGAKDIPILKLVVVGSIWGFCIMNMLFVFMFFIAKITKLNLASTDDVNASVFKKYPLICWCNLVVVAIFVLSSWAVYISNEELSVKLYELISANQTIFFVAGTVVLVGGICVVAKKLYENIKK